MNAPRIKVKKVRMVAVWSLDMIVDKCAICRNYIMDICIECQTEEKVMECRVAWGACNHAFHAHCISQWLKSKKICPLDAKPWAFQNPQESK